MDLSTIYTELIMEHNRSSHNKRALSEVDIREKGYNPSCGDDLTLELKLHQGYIEDAAFTGHGCAISQASASIMIDLIRGKKIEEAHDLAETFVGMIKREILEEEDLQKLGDAAMLQNISNMPARVKCAVLAWHTLKQAMEARK